MHGAVDGMPPAGGAWAERPRRSALAWAMLGCGVLLVMAPVIAIVLGVGNQGCPECGQSWNRHVVIPSLWLPLPGILLVVLGAVAPRWLRA